MSRKLLKIGHRGAAGYVAENTLDSIKRALELKVDGIEVDVHLSSSGDLVVFHDFTLERLTGVSGQVARSSLEDLQKLKIQQQYSIPTLLEVLDLVDNRCLVNIELKGERTAFEACKSIQIYVETKGWDICNFLVSSFNFDELGTVYNINKEIPLGVLVENDLEEAIHFAASVNAYAVHPWFMLLSPSKVKGLQKKGYKVITWTVNEIPDIERVKNFGVDGIISDFPDRI